MSVSPQSHAIRQRSLRYYPDLLVLLVSAIFLIVQLHFSKLAYILAGVLAVSTFFLIYLIWSKRTHFFSKFEISYTVNVFTAVLLAVVLGLSQFCKFYLLGLGLLLIIRVIQTPAPERLGVTVSMLAAVFAAFFVSLTFFHHALTCDEAHLGLAVLILSVATAGWQFWQQQQSLQTLFYEHSQTSQRINALVGVINKLSRFMPTQVWQPIIKNNRSVTIDNKRQQMSVIFSDIAGFTALSDDLSADDLADILNMYMERMTLIAKRHGAVLDKFIGDGMVCFFGAPTTKGVRDDAIACVAMAIDMRREMRVLRHQWQLRGFDGLDVRIGIATGYCHVGNFGSDARMSFTVIGKVANLASRLERQAKSGTILISQATFEYVQHEFNCVPQGEMQLKGFDEKVSTYAVQDPDSEEHKSTDWVEHDLPGFNLHLNFKDIKNYDYVHIKSHLEQALTKVETKAKKYLPVSKSK